MQLQRGLQLGQGLFVTGQDLQAGATVLPGGEFLPGIAYGGGQAHGFEKGPRRLLVAAAHLRSGCEEHDRVRALEADQEIRHRQDASAEVRGHARSPHSLEVPDGRPQVAETGGGSRTAQVVLTERHGQIPLEGARIPLGDTLTALQRVGEPRVVLLAQRLGRASYSASCTWW